MDEPRLNRKNLLGRGRQARVTGETKRKAYLKRLKLVLKKSKGKDRFQKKRNPDTQYGGRRKKNGTFKKEGKGEERQADSRGQRITRDRRHMTKFQKRKKGRVSIMANKLERNCAKILGKGA